jgi:hypothetical protein
MHCIALRCVEDTCLTSLALIGRGVGSAFGTKWTGLDCFGYILFIVAAVRYCCRQMTKRIPLGALNLSHIACWASCLIHV